MSSFKYFYPKLMKQALNYKHNGFINTSLKNNFGNVHNYLHLNVFNE